jgi:hypothetical protein
MGSSQSTFFPGAKLRFISRQTVLARIWDNSKFLPGGPSALASPRRT